MQARPGKLSIVSVSFFTFLALSASFTPARAVDSVSPGPLLEKRTEVFNYIQKAKKNGIGTKPYEEAFARIEGDVAAGKSEEEIKKQLASLIVSLTAQANNARVMKTYSPMGGGGAGAGDLSKYKDARGTSVPTSVMEGILYDCIVQHRKEAGVPSIRRNSKLDQVARDQADDMAKRDFFSHTNPDHKGPLERAQARGLVNVGINENIASVSRRGNGVIMARLGDKILMDSPGHRGNILAANHKACGIGVAYNKHGWIKICQVFSPDDP